MNPIGQPVLTAQPPDEWSERFAPVFQRVRLQHQMMVRRRATGKPFENCVEKGCLIGKGPVVKEIGSGINDTRPKLTRLLKKTDYGILLVEHKDRLARFGTNYMQLLLEMLGVRLEIVNLAENGRDELMLDFIAIITSFCARLYGRRRSSRKIERLIAELLPEGNRNK